MGAMSMLRPEGHTSQGINSPSHTPYMLTAVTSHKAMEMVTSRCCSCMQQRTRHNMATQHIQVVSNAVRPIQRQLYLYMIRSHTTANQHPIQLTQVMTTQLFVDYITSEGNKAESGEAAQLWPSPF